ncbi:hypothetical protein C6380_05215 [Pseudomonas syringae pv. actinidiae]|uniref:hypothetical protein n=1 Tax=Pseudomonas syringae TaxID=317 RepID=UPI000BB54BB4|nr:hypothetical protein [Pseudomonas syringae]PBK51297.1 hypothetical protein BUE61_17560 [Pseudomonas syringae pv. actinidiae]PBK51865.1 hypothetical protein BUE60_17785 [Pseudomonas syringae pv. actinidiae]RJX54346.1 hypothetical protein C6379_15930 [Pseudomonas syringae pv. actinidiae]RJX60199.1 hypothetical protein C6380_05215 [Pseudomonas syringae pv. actinidiae]RJX60324.1 hypothetical protein C6383_13810 [Pseudomonas syringae pv. actinidiae]
MEGSSNEFEYISQYAAALGLIRDGERTGMRSRVTERVWINAGDFIPSAQCESIFASITQCKSLESIFLGGFRALEGYQWLAEPGLKCEPLRVLMRHLNMLIQKNTESVHRAVLDPVNFSMPLRYDEKFTWSDFTQALLRVMVEMKVVEPELAESLLGVDLGL